jgi:hypothetical protein
MLNGALLVMSSLNQIAGTRTISNNTADATNSELFADPTVTQNSNPISVGGTGSVLTIQGPNGGTGTGTLSVSVASGNFVVSDPTSSLNISATVTIAVAGGTLGKTGGGTLNLSGTLDAFSAGFEVNEGTAALLPGFVVSNPLHTFLGVSNLNTGAGSNVVLNIETSANFATLGGQLATPSSGTNAATINLIGASTVLRLAYSFGGGVYKGDIAGSGSLSLQIGSNNPETFAGRNTYTGTTTVTGGTLAIDGITTGQGNYIIGDTLAGNGTVGLAAGNTITISGGRLTPGSRNVIGTFSVSVVNGKVVFSNGGSFLVDIASGGLSDLLAIKGGDIDLTSTRDTLSLNSLAGAFDGSVYTIATFSHNVGNGVFDTVTGLPSTYTVAYGDTSISLVPVAVPEPQPSLLLVCAAGFYGICRSVSQRYSQGRRQKSLRV